MNSHPPSSNLLNTVSASHPFSESPSLEHSNMLAVEPSMNLAKQAGDGTMPHPPQMNSLEDVLNMAGINEHSTEGSAKGPPWSTAAQTTHSSLVSSSSNLPALSALSPSLLAAATGRSLGYNFALSGAANVLAYTSIHQNGQGPVSSPIPSIATGGSASLHPSTLLSSLGAGERGPKSSITPSLNASMPSILKAHKPSTASSSLLSSLPGKASVSAVSSSNGKATGPLLTSLPGGNPQPVPSLVGKAPQSHVTSWKWTSSPYQGNLGGKRQAASTSPVGTEETPANKKMVTTKGPENSAEAAAMNIKQSLILELQRTQLTLKQLEMVQRQHLLQGKVKEARDVEQKINLLLQRQKQVIHTIQTASWDGTTKRSTAIAPDSSGIGASALHTTPTSSPVTQVGGANVLAGGVIPPIPSLLARPAHTVGEVSSHASTTANLPSALLPRSLPLSIPSMMSTSTTATMTVNANMSPPVVCSPSFVAVSSAFPYSLSAPLQSNNSLQSTTSQSTPLPKSTHLLQSLPSVQPNTSLLYSSPTPSISATHSMGQHSTVSTVSQAPGMLPRSVGVSSSSSHPNPAQSVALHSDNVITAQEALLLLNNPTLQEKLTIEKLQHLNSIRLQALNDYQRQRIQAFMTSLPPHEVPKDITELKRVLHEKGFQIQVPVYLAAQAIPKLYAQELMQRASAAVAAQSASGSTASVSPSSATHPDQRHRQQQQNGTPSSSLLPIPSLLGQSATLSLSATGKGTAGGVKTDTMSARGVSPSPLHHALSVAPSEVSVTQQQQQAQTSHPWTDVQQRLKGIIAHMEQQQQSQTASSLYGSAGQQDWRMGRTGYSSHMENLSSNSSYMTRAQARAKQLAELRAQQQRQRSLNTQEAYITSHMKAIVRRDHELLSDRAGDERPFSSVEDAVKRLLPYHIYHEEDAPPEQEKKFDLLHKNICNLLVSRQNGLVARYHRLMLKEAEKEVSTGLEVYALREFVDAETPPTPTPPPAPLLNTWPPLDPFNTTMSGLTPPLHSTSTWPPLSMPSLTQDGRML